MDVPISPLISANRRFYRCAGKPAVKVDIIFPVLHGTDGEDGSIQGLIKAMDLPMVGTGVLGSSLSMNKIVAKRLLREAGLPVTDFMTFSFNEKDDISFKKISKKLGVPFMVKSASLGSSVGVTKVNGKKDFKRAVDEAFKYDNEMLAEEYISGREIECAVFPEPIVADVVRSAEKPLERVAELRGGLERPQAERVDEDQTADPRRFATRKRRRDRATERLADEHRWRGARGIDQLTEPRRDAPSVEFGAIDVRRALTGQVGGNDAVRRGQIRDHPHPVRRAATRAMQQDDRRAFTSLQHRGRHSSEFESAFGHR
jgi:hypothetical protein